MCATDFVAITLLWQTKCRARQIFKLCEGHLLRRFLNIEYESKEVMRQGVCLKHTNILQELNIA